MKIENRIINIRFSFFTFVVSGKWQIGVDILIFIFFKRKMEREHPLSFFTDNEN